MKKDAREKYQIPKKNQLKQWYTKEWMTLEEIAEQVEVSVGIVRKWFRKYNIPVRSKTEMALRGRRKLSAEKLRELYVDRELNQIEIGDKFGVSRSAINNWLIEYGIPVRSRSEARLRGRRKLSTEELRTLYVDNWMSAEEIASQVKVSVGTVYNWLKENKIKRRKSFETVLGPNGYSLTAKNLRRLYLEDRMTCVDIGKELGFSGSTIRNAILKYGIPLRDRSENQLKGRKLSAGELTRLYLDEQMSVLAIANYAGVCDNTVDKWLDEYQIARRRKLEFSADKLRELYIDNRMSARAISKIFEVSDTTIRRWLGKYGISIFDREGTITDESGLRAFLDENPNARSVAALATMNGFSMDAAQILQALYPGRFADASQIARMLPTAVPSILDAIVPVQLEMMEDWFNRLPDVGRATQRRLEDVLYQVLYEVYQKNFNDDAEGTLEELTRVKQTHVKIAPIVERVEEEYRNAIAFSIPGYGRMK